MNANRRTIAWQGWQLSLPHRWDPVKLEGDHANGYALFADTLRPRIGLRWQTRRQKKFNAETAVQLALKNEVGQLAADEAKPFEPPDESWRSPTLYIEPQTPGRDVYCVYSENSNRLLQIAYHANRRENILARTLLPTLCDHPADCAMPWSIFDLNFIIPGGMKLTAQRLSVGDLSLTFADNYTQLTIRQIAIAQLALQRQSLDKWITDHQKSDTRYFRSNTQLKDISLQVANRTLSGRISTKTRKRRYALMWHHPKTQITIALHDAPRDRLILMQSPDESLLRVVADSIATIS